MEIEDFGQYPLEYSHRTDFNKFKISIDDGVEDNDRRRTRQLLALNVSILTALACGITAYDEAYTSSYAYFTVTLILLSYIWVEQDMRAENKKALLRRQYEAKENETEIFFRNYPEFSLDTYRDVEDNEFSREVQLNRNMDVIYSRSSI